MLGVGKSTWIHEVRQDEVLSVAHSVARLVSTYLARVWACKYTSRPEAGLVSTLLGSSGLS
jgi:predicted kinase